MWVVVLGDDVLPVVSDDAGSSSGADAGFTRKKPMKPGFTPPVRLLEQVLYSLRRFMTACMSR